VNGQLHAPGIDGVMDRTHKAYFPVADFQIFPNMDQLVIIQVKVKLSLCFNHAPRHEGVLEEWRYSSTHSSSRH
jgi:hypothetical protein